MKKNKTATAAEKTKAAADENIKNEAAEKAAEGTLSFKKVLYGFDPEEVIAFVNELIESNENAARLHESKLSSLKEELVLSNRERDSYSRELKTLRSAQPQPVVEKIIVTDNNSADLAPLKEEIERLRAENFRLQEAASQISDGNDEKISSLEAENRELTVLADSLKRENAQLSAEAQRYNSLFEEYSGILKKSESIGAELESKSAEAEMLKGELAGKAEEIRLALDENREIAQKAAELEVKNGILLQKAEENEAVIEHLREEGKAQAHENAEKISLLEAELSKSRLAVQKDIQLHEYYVSSAELAVAELSKQLEKIKQSFINLQGE